MGYPYMLPQHRAAASAGDAAHGEAGPGAGAGAGPTLRSPGALHSPFMLPGAGQGGVVPYRGLHPWLHPLLQHGPVSPASAGLFQAAATAAGLARSGPGLASLAQVGGSAGSGNPVADQLLRQNLINSILKQNMAAALAAASAASPKQVAAEPRPTHAQPQAMSSPTKPAAATPSPCRGRLSQHPLLASRTAQLKRPDPPNLPLPTSQLRFTSSISFFVQYTQTRGAMDRKYLNDIELIFVSFMSHSRKPAPQGKKN